jgi:hypothetical protein
MLADPDRGAARIGICWRTGASDESRVARPCQAGSAREPRVRRRAVTARGFKGNDGASIARQGRPSYLRARDSGEVVQSPTSCPATIPPEACRLRGETIALAEVFLRPLDQLAKPLRPHEHTAVLLRTLWAYRGLRGDLTRTAAALGQPQHGALSPLPRPRTQRWRVRQGVSRVHL